MAAEPEYVRCRFYEQKFPEVDDVVVVQVKRIAEMGAYVSLLEYNGIKPSPFVLGALDYSSHV